MRFSEMFIALIIAFILGGISAYLMSMRVGEYVFWINLFFSFNNVVIKIREKSDPPHRDED